ncbi:MAG: alpha/beta hydrolase [Bacteroidales bacterium]|nr:alpha/beta hydrolase [Bacteroidales bacterium]
MKTQNLKFDPINMRYADTGTGTPVVLLHGYLESLKIWYPFADILSENNRVICPDLPGHGYSGIIQSVHTMELMASYIKKLLDRLSVDSCILAGHSMGGYVALAFAEKYPEYLKGLVLFHSVPFADTDDKKINRDREIDLVWGGKKKLLITSNIPKGFSDTNLVRLKTQISKAKKIGRNTPDAGIVALLKGMKCRPDRTAVISECPVPIMWILGRKDNYINFDQVHQRAVSLGKNLQMVTLENSGHMGFIEEPERSLEVLKEFIDQCVSGS